MGFDYLDEWPAFIGGWGGYAQVGGDGRGNVCDAYVGGHAGGSNSRPEEEKGNVRVVGVRRTMHTGIPLHVFVEVPVRYLDDDHVRASIWVKRGCGHSGDSGVRGQPRGQFASGEDGGNAW